MIALHSDGLIPFEPKTVIVTLPPPAETAQSLGPTGCDWEPMKTASWIQRLEWENDAWKRFATERLASGGPLIWT